MAWKIIRVSYFLVVHGFLKAWSQAAINLQYYSDYAVVQQTESFIYNNTDSAELTIVDPLNFWDWISELYLSAGLGFTTL